MITSCYTCGRPLGFSDAASVLTVPLTDAERAAWYREQLGMEDRAVNDWLTYLQPRAITFEAPYAQTYTICRDCIQPVLHARMPSAQALRDQFAR